ncbi:hypothetical protein [Achromobacter sp. 2789STDY5608628]|uniref:DNA polymerase III subunit beta family protein n=1 Tax=Achromobacter sp. 2789STDY5608628 TaxID=1806493 RepID=UPI0006BEF984|nr:hypothetical protein [Achromobacter sp. 2789STDY5608628]CUJ80938.1 DNA polymerase III subunit beta [Achromobacter sp. 2789STDY5608628]
MNMLNLNESKATRPRVMTTRAALKAALRIAAKKDIRYYLNGVSIEADSECTRLIATDGHSMLILQHQADNQVDGPVSLIVPGDIVRQVIAGPAKGLQRVMLDLCPEGAGIWSIPLLHLGDRTRLTFAQIAGKFPDWRRVVPAAVTGKAAQLSPALLSAMNAAAADLGSKHTTVSHNGQSPAVIRPESHISEQFIGLVMPMRDAAPNEWAAPTWCATPKNSQEQSQ